MQKPIIFALAALVFTGAAMAALTVWPIGETRNLTGMTGNAERGAYLARMSGCIACHTDSENGGAPLAGGVALETDFGTFYSPNLTTDKEQGMGDWTIETFEKAVRQGVSPDGKSYYPAFPYPFYRKFSDQDVADLWMAFQTVPPAAQPSKDQDVVFPFNFRGGLKLWRALFLDQTGFQTIEGQNEAWNRGKYIVEGPAHCGACHTPRNTLGARQAELRLHGADKLPGGGKSPPITTAALMENGWTEKSLAYALRTGVLPDGDTFGGSMGEVVRDGTRFLSQDDLNAIAGFLMNQE